MMVTDPTSSWKDFLAAVRAARSGNFQPGKEIIARVRAKFGREAAERQKQELQRFVDRQPDRRKQ